MTADVNPSRDQLVIDLILPRSSPATEPGLSLPGFRIPMAKPVGWTWTAQAERTSFLQFGSDSANKSESKQRQHGGGERERESVLSSPLLPNHLGKREKKKIISGKVGKQIRVWRD